MNTDKIIKEFDYKFGDNLYKNIGTSGGIIAYATCPEEVRAFLKEKLEEAYNAGYNDKEAEEYERDKNVK